MPHLGLRMSIAMASRQLQGEDQISTLSASTCDFKEATRVYRALKKGGWFTRVQANNPLSIQDPRSWSADPSVCVPMTWHTAVASQDGDAMLRLIECAAVTPKCTEAEMSRCSNTCSWIIARAPGYKRSTGEMEFMESRIASSAFAKKIQQGGLSFDSTSAAESQMLSIRRRLQNQSQNTLQNRRKRWLIRAGESCIADQVSHLGELESLSGDALRRAVWTATMQKMANGEWRASLTEPDFHQFLGVMDDLEEDDSSLEAYRSIINSQGGPLTLRTDAEVPPDLDAHVAAVFSAGVETKLGQRAVDPKQSKTVRRREKTSAREQLTRSFDVARSIAYTKVFIDMLPSATNGTLSDQSSRIGSFLLDDREDRTVTDPAEIVRVMYKLGMGQKFERYLVDAVGATADDLSRAESAWRTRM